MFNEAETISTLRFGQRAKSIKNTPKINREYTVAELQVLLEKAERSIAELKQRVIQLESHITNAGLQLPKLDVNISPAKAGNIKEVKKEDEDDDGNAFLSTLVNSFQKIKVRKITMKHSLRKMKRMSEQLFLHFVICLTTTILQE